MPAVSFTSVFFGVRMRFKMDVDGSDESSSDEAPPLPLDSTEARLSPTAQRMQKKAREKAKERDWESLNDLEIAAAAASQKARIKDKQSLDILIRCTDNLMKRATIFKTIRAFKTPTRTTFFPPARHFKGMKGTPLSFEPPFSTPSDVRRTYKTDESGNEFEDFLAKESAKRSAVESRLKDKKKRNSFTTLLESSKSSDTGLTKSKAEQSAYIESQAASFLDLVNKVQQKDREDELALTRDLADAMDSPTASPTSSIKHLRKDSGVSNSDEELDENDFIDFWLASGSPLPADDGESEMEEESGVEGDDERSTSSESDGDDERSTSLESDEDDVSDEDDWEIV